jgi:hypothetical protein
MTIRFTMLLLVAAGLNACGGKMDMTCDDVQVYQLAVESKRVESPEGLDNLDPLREVPLPEASPREALPPGSDCVDRPPKVDLGT